MLKLIVGLLLVVPGAAWSESLIPTRVDARVREYVDVHQYPLVVIGVVDGEKSEIKGYGLENGRAPDEHTLFEIGSITKTFTALLLARAVNAHEVRLDEPVAELLPGVRVPSRNRKQITLEDLATQHSGLPRLPTNFAPAHLADPYRDYDAGRLESFLNTYELTRDPGAEYEYSNLGVGLLGFALGKRAGGYEKLLQVGVLMPLGMTASGLRPRDTDAHLAKGHDTLGNPVSNWHFDALAACGGIVSDASDMLKYVKANLDVRTALWPAVQLAQTPRASVDASRRIGLVWMQTLQGQTSLIWHDGMTGGYAATLALVPAQRRGVVVLTNVARGVDDISRAVLFEEAPLPPAHRDLPLTAEQLAAYSGVYQLAPKFLLSVQPVGQRLMAQATGQSAFPLFADAPDEFVAEVGGISISFKRDAKGVVDRLILHQGGDRQAARLSDAQVDATYGNSEISLDPALLSDYVGEYAFSGDLKFVITREGNQLLARLGQQPALAVYASAPDKFFYRVIDARLEFERDAAGRIITLVFYQNGATRRAPRLP
jgi:CubicO group peptidase (beta-lactamase class C family)